MPEPDDRKTVQSIPPIKWVATIVVYLIIPLILFVCAGDPGWWQAWIFSLLIFTAGIGGRILAEQRHPGLLAERQSKEKFNEAKKWDKVLSPLMSFSVGFPQVIVAGLDHRFGWSHALPLWLNLVGILLLAVGYGFAVWALVENRFFSGVVRIQSDREHKVCDSGPYRILRHPGYAGNILALPGIVLALSSIWTLIPTVFTVLIVVIRTALEDRTLQEELPGYREYAQCVRYRLFPGIY